MEKSLDGLKKEATATFVSPNSGTKEIIKFSNVTEAVEYYKSKSSDSKLSERQRKRYQLLFDFAAEPGRTLAEIYKKIEDEKNKKRLEAERLKQKKEKEKRQGLSDHSHNDNGLGASTGQAPKKNIKNVYPKIEDCKSKEEIRKILEKKQENASDSYKKSLQTFINMVNKPDVTVEQAIARIVYDKQRHSKASQSSKKRVLDQKLKPSSTSAPIQTSSKSQSSNTPISPRPQIPVTRTLPKSQSQSMGISPKSPSSIVKGVPKSQTPKSKERRDSNEGIPQYPYEGVDNEREWMNVWGFDHE